MISVSVSFSAFYYIKVASISMSGGVSISLVLVLVGSIGIIRITIFEMRAVLPARNYLVSTCSRRAAGFGLPLLSCMGSALN